MQSESVGGSGLTAGFRLHKIPCEKSALIFMTGTNKTQWVEKLRVLEVWSSSHTLCSGLGWVSWSWTFERGSTPIASSCKMDSSGSRRPLIRPYNAGGAALPPEQGSAPGCSTSGRARAQLTQLIWGDCSFFQLSTSEFFFLILLSTWV